jgi:hypothetical protein
MSLRKKDLMHGEHECLGLVAFPAPLHCPHCRAVLTHHDLVGETTLAIHTCLKHCRN